LAVIFFENGSIFEVYFILNASKGYGGEKVVMGIEG
jgi:hypothetical protein